MLPLRDENPTRRTAVVTIALVVVNVAVFGFVQPSADTADGIRYAYEYAAIPCEVVEGRPLTWEEIPDAGGTGGCVDQPTSQPPFPSKHVYLATLISMFLHADWIHLAGNMLFLWIFGNNVEDHLGRLGYLVFYLVGGVVATTAHVAVQLDDTSPLLGASGAVAAVMGAYLVWFPQARVLTLLMFVIPMRVRAFWLLAIWFASQFLLVDSDAVAWMSHVGGFAFGVLVGLAIRASSRIRRTAWTADHRGSGRGPWDTRHGGRHPWEMPPDDGQIGHR